MKNTSLICSGVLLLSSTLAFADDVPTNAELFRMLQEQKSLINSLQLELEEARQARTIVDTDSGNTNYALNGNEVKDDELVDSEPSATENLASLLPKKTWNGFYGGISANYVDGTLKGDTPILDEFNISKPNPQGVMLEGFAGWNKQFENNVVLGLEGALSVGDASKEQSLMGDDFFGGEFGRISAKSEITAMAKAKVKLGYAINNFLPYITLGGVAARTRYSGNVSIIGETEGGPVSINLGDSSQKTVLGWTAGAGIDYKIGANGFLRAAYEFTDLSSERYLSSFTDLGSKSFELHEAKIGFGYAF